MEIVKNNTSLGETGTVFSVRHYGHRSDITKKPFLTLSKHFNQDNCSFNNISIIGIEVSKLIQKLGNKERVGGNTN